MHWRSEITGFLTAQHKPIDDITQATDLSETPNLSVTFGTALLKRHPLSTIMLLNYSGVLKNWLPVGMGLTPMWVIPVWVSFLRNITCVGGVKSVLATDQSIHYWSWPNKVQKNKCVQQLTFNFLFFILFLSPPALFLSQAYRPHAVMRTSSFTVHHVRASGCPFAGRALWVCDERTFERIWRCMLALITDWVGVGI